MSFFTRLLDAADGAEAGGSALEGLLSMGIPILLLVVVFYFFLYRPQKKQEKAVREMRSSLEPGDVITTSGGIVGVVIKIKDDMVLIESGADRTKFQIKSWAVHSVIARADGSTDES